MMPFILLVLGLFLVFLEFYLPGAILGVFGGIVILGSFLAFISEGYGPFANITFFIVIVIALTALIKFALFRIKTARPEKSIYSDANQEGFQASSFDLNAIGKKGIALSDLKPGGYIIVDDVQMQALSESGYIEKGAHVEVVGGEGESLIVKLVK